MFARRAFVSCTDHKVLTAKYGKVRDSWRQQPNSTEAALVSSCQPWMQIRNSINHRSLMASAEPHKVVEQQRGAVLWHVVDQLRKLAFVSVSITTAEFGLPEILERPCYQQSSKERFLQHHLPLYHWQLLQ